MSKKNILHEAIADSKQIRESAMANARQLVLKQYESDIKKFVNEALNDDEYEEDMATEAEELEETEDMEKDVDLDDLEDEEEEEDLDLDLGDADDDDEDEDDLDLDETLGLTEADLDEVIASVVQEVDHADLGDLEVVDPDKRADSRGLEDLDKKEDGWETKKAPRAKGAEVYGGGTYHEAVQKLRVQNAKLVKENLFLKKANQKLQESVKDVQLFNAKVLYTNKLFEGRSLSGQVRNTVVEQMDSATSLNEVKKLFNTWKTAIGLMSESTNATKSDKKSLSEAFGINKKEERGVSEVEDLLGESSNPFSQKRLQALAGIIND